MTELFLVRHGETAWNKARRIQGSSDIPLNDTGRAQARATGELLARRRFDAIAASPLIRAMETARIIAEVVGLADPQPIPEVVERHYGDAEGMTWQQVEAAFPDRDRIPGRESRRAVGARVLPALIAYADRHEGETCIVVTHGGVIRAVLDAVVPHLDPVPVVNASVHSFDVVDGGLRLIASPDALEDASVLPGAAPLVE